ncbi:MAG: two component transcriptional regulator, winged helix family [Xanthobacteraceae bacterium]|nr:two component transcriptional regulator, winged helix family [Xanthobacteraceae bacterium]
MHQLVGVSRHEVPANPLDRPSHLGRVLVVDDDRDMRHAIIAYLNDRQCAAIGCGVGDVPHHLRHNQFSLVVLDVQAGPSGRLAVLRQIRDRSPVPVILVAGQRCDEADRIAALELGADDCLIKPFDPRELLARAGAILRRGRAVDLTKGAYALLVAFLEAPCRPLSREQLLSATRTHPDVFDRSIDVQVLRLRRKLEPDPAQPRLIRTERGIGYVFDAPVETVF